MPRWHSRRGADRVVAVDVDVEGAGKEVVGMGSTARLAGG
jgi:hypothetical protein